MSQSLKNVALAAGAAAGALTTAVEGTSLDVIDKNITYIRTAGRNVQERIQQTIIMIIEHAQKHGDCDRARRLVEAMPKGMRRSLVVKHFGMFSPIAVTINDKDRTKNSVRLRKSDSKQFNNFNVAGAKAVPWYTLEPEQMPDNSWDEDKVNAVVISLADRLEKRINENKIDADAVEAARTKIAALRAAAR